MISGGIIIVQIITAYNFYYIVKVIFCLSFVTSGFPGLSTFKVVEKEDGAAEVPPLELVGVPCMFALP